MDVAVGLVQAYLHANGYLTVTEFPVMEEVAGRGLRPVTDLDVLAVRLPGAGHIVHERGTRASRAERAIEPDETLIDANRDDYVDFIIGEVKEGVAELNRGARRPTTLITALRRFTFVKPDVAERIVAQLTEDGEAVLPERRVRVRLVAFGSRAGDGGPYKTILLRRCLDFILSNADDSMLRATHLKNPTLALLSLLVKSGMDLGPS